MGSKQHRDALLSELPLPMSDKDTVLQALGIAIAVEENFGVVLTDGDISPDALGSVESVSSLLVRHLGVA